MLNTTPVPIRHLKVLLVEDSPIMQRVLGDHLRAIPALELVGIAETAADGITAFPLYQPDVVILDLTLREGTGFEVLHEIKQRASACRVLIFTSHDTASFRSRCAAEGADAFFSKSEQSDQLLKFLRSLAAGRASEQAHAS